MNFKAGRANGDGERAPRRGAPPPHLTPHRTPDDHAMRLQQLKHKVQEGAYRIDPDAVAVALLMRVDPRRDPFTGLLLRPDGRSPAAPVDLNGHAG